jgi:uroporphyrinogen-III decarboxylase
MALIMIINNIDNNGLIKLKKLHMSVFRGEESYIPLIVNPPCPGRPSKSDFWQNVTSATEQEAKALIPKVSICSDWIPTINVSLYQNIAVPSLFGANIIHPKDSDPVCKPCFNNIDEACEAGVPAVEGRIIDNMFDDFKKAKQVIQNEYFLSFITVTSPFDFALLLLGAEFILNLMTNPSKVLEFLNNLTEISIQLIKIINKESGNINIKEGSLKSRGIFSPGFRLACDAIVNFSKDNIREFVLPIIAKFRENLGPMYIHFCTEPAPSDHILPVLSESDDVIAVDNWQGPEIFIGQDSLTELQSKIAIIGDIDVRKPERMTDFLNQKSIMEVPRKGGRGLIMTSCADNIDDGRRIYNQWRELQER